MVQKVARLNLGLGQFATGKLCPPNSNWVLFSNQEGAPVGQCIQCGPIDLAVPSSSPAQGEIFSTVTTVHCTQLFISNLTSS